MTDATTAPYQGYGTKPYRAYVLFAIVVIYTFNFIDRILLAVLQEGIKTDLHVDDFQLGLLGGPYFAVLYTLAGIPIARWAERSNRISIIAMGAAVWSVMTAACGIAMNFAQLAAARIGVGIGEAACSPPAQSVISDYFPAQRRATALAIYGLGIPIGTMIAALGGGWLVGHMSWRFAFLALGAPGLIAAILFKLTVREPPRAGSQGDKAPSFGATLKTLLGKPTFWHIAFAGALISFVGYSTSQFLVSFIVRNYDIGATIQEEIANASYALGIISGVSVGIGTFAGGFLCDRLSSRFPSVYAWLPGVGVLIALPLYLFSFTQTSFQIAFAILLVAPIFHYMYLGPMFAVVQSVSPVRMRNTAVAVSLLIINLIGYGLGPPTMGALSDFFANTELTQLGLSVAACKLPTAGPECAAPIAHGLKTAMFCVVCVLIWPAIHFFLAGRTLLKDRVS